ncbi:MAG: phosphate ABC transporter substrate-binding protein PstS [Cyanobacteria bacterium P01_H01_bin.15]
MFLINSFRRAAALSAATVMSGAIAFGVSAQGRSITGAGASFPAPLYKLMFSNYNSAKVNYNSIGSGGGIRQFAAKEVAFGASDAPPKAKDLGAESDNVLLVPTAGGAVAVTYNLPGYNGRVQLQREALWKIFNGEVSNWKQINSAYPDQKIVPVVRADGSGTTFIFTAHLARTSNGKIKANKAPTWPAGFLKGEKNDGVAAAVKRTPGAIGYVQDTYARKNGLKTAFLQNKAGRYVEPSLDEANKALEGVRFNTDFTTANSDDPDDGYPIVGVTWLMLYKIHPNPAMAAPTRKLATWMMSDEAQAFNTKLEYTKIPKSVRTRAIAEIAKVE